MDIFQYYILKKKKSGPYLMNLVRDSNWTNFEHKVINFYKTIKHKIVGARIKKFQISYGGFLRNFHICQI